VCRNRTCLNPILPRKPHKPKLISPTPTVEQTATSDVKVKRVVERKSYRAMLAPDSNKVKQSSAELRTAKPAVDATPDSTEINDSGQRGHKLFGRQKFASVSSSSLSRLKHKDRGSSGDTPWKKRSDRDPWKKRRSLLASDRASGSSWFPRRVPSSSSLASLSDTDSGKHISSASQSRNILKVSSLFHDMFLGASK